MDGCDAIPLAGVGGFVKRGAELARLEDWWVSPHREPVNLYGRRRVGKSWLFRRFAHDKPSVILVADRVAPGQQLTSMAAQLEGALGVLPQVGDIAALFRLLYHCLLYTSPSPRDRTRPRMPSS